MKKIVIIIVGLAIAGAAAFFVLGGDDNGTAPPPINISPVDTQPVPDEPETAQRQPETVKEEIYPSFDVVRISPEGDTVTAGRAEPEAEVVIYDRDNEVGRITADENGEWVFVPDVPLPAGEHKLSLVSINPKGEKRESVKTVVLVVPEKEEDSVVAVKLSHKDGEAEIMQSPVPSKDAGRVSFSSVNYDDGERIKITGLSDENSFINVYIDDNFIGQIRADDSGKWKIRTEAELSEKNYILRADMLDKDGNVKERAEIKFNPQKGKGIIPDDIAIVVEKGNSLWRIASRIYGSGYAYMVIFKANKEQIKDPDVIYPGQVFVLPPIVKK